MYRTGQLIWLKDIDNFSGHAVKESRLCVVRRVYSENCIDLRTLSTIYYDKKNKVPAKTLKEAKEVITNLFEARIKENSQCVIFEPDKDNTLNFSFSFGNMISKKLNLNEYTHEPLLDNNGNPLYISEEKEIELSYREALAIAQDIIYYFNIGIKDKNKKKDTKEEQPV